MIPIKRTRAVVAKILVVILVITAIVTIRICGNRGVALAQQAPFAISRTPPTELNPTGGGPAAATLQQAAEFAWEEFFALNWPAGPQPNQRDTPSSSCSFGDQSSSCAGPLVWETFRGKVEIFPGNGEPPGYSATPPSYGYDAPPQYNYFSPVGPCTGAASSPTAWVNLDETDQITVDSMYAGVVSANPSDISANNSAPQLIRFLAKANRVEYAYVAKHKWWDGSAPVVNTALYVLHHLQDPADADNYVLLPSGSIEVKAGWRVLNPSERASGRFHTATVRYYEKVKDDICYQQATFGLVALHIIQKTPMAPYFIYATFEQADNILDANGRPVEDVDGSPLPPSQPCRSDQTQPCPTTPSVTLNDTATVNAGGFPPQVILVPSNAEYCTSNTMTTPPNRLFYLNTSTLAGLPTRGYICINKRDNDIPPVIIDTNKTAHALIQQVTTNSVWQYYKLINVQYQPINKDHASLYGTQPGENDPSNANNPSTYYLANIVVETNRPLQLFSGGLNVGTGSNSDYASHFLPPPQFPPPSQLPQSGTGIHFNTFYQGSGYNMGGCMGCHGSQGQSQGGDFSVILARGPVFSPEPPAAHTSSGAAVILRNRSLH
jgi:hypothetical protein